jgi:nitrogen fixation NifU-like protein
MSVEELYQEAILTLAKQGSAIGRLEDPTVSVRVDNPLCGDRVMLDAMIVEGRITATGYKVQGCALCQAAAAVIHEQIPGTAIGELGALKQQVAAYLTGAEEHPQPWQQLSAFEPVKGLKSRHECVLLPFIALEKAIAEAP